VNGVKSAIIKSACKSDRKVKADVRNMHRESSGVNASSKLGAKRRRRRGVGRVFPSPPGTPTPHRRRV